MLRHAIFVGTSRQYSLEEGIWLVSDCDLVVVNGFVRTRVLQWRKVSKACVKGMVGLSEPEELLTSCTGLPIPRSSKLLVGGVQPCAWDTVS